jgi:hypothetical protein
VFVFADEAGNFDFNRKFGASTYFLIGTVTMTDLALEQSLLDLRRDLAWRGFPIESAFHATSDQQAVRNEVFTVLQGANFRYDVTILEKCKTKPRLQNDWERFYKTAWYLHFKYVAPKIARQTDELFVIAATIGTRKRRSIIRAGIEDVVNQATVCSTWQVAFWPAEGDPGLQVADYCTWAVGRKKESGDARHYQLIASKVATEFEPFAFGTKKYY